MGRPAYSLRTKLTALCAAGLIACGFLPFASAFANDATIVPMLASSLLDGSAAIVSEDVALTPIDASDNAEGNAVIEPVVGSFTVDGLTFAVNADGGITLVAVSSDVILSAAAESGEVEGSLSIPPSITYDGVTYDVTTVGPYAFYLSGATQVELPVSITSVNDRAFRSSDVAWADVDADNPNLTSFDGALYSADLTSLLLIPEGRAGAVLLPCETEVAEPSKFSHCSLVDALSVEEGGAAFASWEGLLYSFDGTTLLRVPAGATDITIREGCATIAAGAMEGCAKLERINAPASVTSVSPDVFEPMPSISVAASVALGDKAAKSEAESYAESPEEAKGATSSSQLTAMVALSRTQEAAPKVDASSIKVVLPNDADSLPWMKVGIALETSPEELPIATLSSAATYAASATFNANGGVFNFYYRNGTNFVPSGSTYPDTSKGTPSTYTVSTSNSAVVYSNNVQWWESSTRLGCFYPYRAGYTMTGWTGSATINSSTGSASMVNGGTYTAQWTPAVYTITLDKNGGSGGTSVIYLKYATGWYSNSSATTRIDAITPPTRAGYTFDGYKGTDKNGMTYTYTTDPIAGTTTVGLQDSSAWWSDFTSDTTLTAQWTKNAIYTITLDSRLWKSSTATQAACSATTAGTTAIYYWVGKGWYNTASPSDTATAATTATALVTAPTLKGYAFGGYYIGKAPSSSSHGAQKVTTAGKLVSTNSVTESTTWYAMWSINSVYTISLDSKIWASSTSTSYSSPTTIGTPKIYCWKGVGWFSSSVSYGASPTGAAMTSDDLITPPTAESYTYDGYYTGKAGTGSQKINGKRLIAITEVSADATWYVKWNVGSVYTITLNSQLWPSATASSPVCSATNAGTTKIYYWDDIGWFDYMPTSPSDEDNACYFGDTLGTTPPALEGYVYCGYSEEKAASSVSVIGGSTILTYSVTSDETWYAVWRIDDVYTVTLDSKLWPSSSATTATASATTAGTTKIYYWKGVGWFSSSKSYGANPTGAATTSTDLVATSPTLKGYAFGGYWTTKTGAGTQKVEGKRLTSTAAVTKDTTWYAKWTQNAIQTVNVYQNAGDTTTIFKTLYLWYGKGWYDTSTPSYSTTQVTTIGTPTRDGYTYLGTNTTSSATTNQYKMQTSGTFPSVTAYGTASTAGTYSRYVVWSKNKVSTVNLYLNAGDTTTLYKTVYLWYGKGWYDTASPDDSTKALTTIGTPKWDGRTYKGFATSSSATEASYWKTVRSFPSVTDATFGGAATAKTTNLYAVWVGKTITIKWDSMIEDDDGNLLEDRTFATTSQEHSSTATPAKVSLPSGEPEWHGRVFTGWYTDPYGGDQVTNATDLPTSSTIYFAHWAEDVYTISYDYAGGSASYNPSTYIITVGFSLNNPTRKGYAFTGWSGDFVDDKGNVLGPCLDGEDNMSVESEEGATGNRKYTAHWQANHYTVEYYNCAGTYLLSTDDGFIYDEWRDLAADPGSNEASSDGYELLGWAIDPGQKSASYDFGSRARNLATGAKGDTVRRLYLAEAPKTIKLTWVSQEAEFDEVSLTYQAGTKVPMPENEPTNQEGWAFMGWWTAEDGGTRVTGETALPTQDATYYAHWSPIVAVTVPLEVTIKLDQLGIEAPEEGDGYIESLSASALKMASIDFVPEDGATELFGGDAASVLLQLVPGDEESSEVSFWLGGPAAYTGDDLSLFALPDGFGSRLGVTYRLVIDDEDILARLTERLSGGDADSEVGRVVYTVALAG